MTITIDIKYVDIVLKGVKGYYRKIITSNLQDSLEKQFKIKKSQLMKIENFEIDKINAGSIKIGLYSDPVELTNKITSNIVDSIIEIKKDSLEEL
jgi:hypothetical protein